MIYSGQELFYYNHDTHCTNKNAIVSVDLAECRHSGCHCAECRGTLSPHSWVNTINPFTLVSRDRTKLDTFLNLLTPSNSSAAYSDTLINYERKKVYRIGSS